MDGKCCILTKTCKYSVDNGTCTPLTYRELERLDTEMSKTVVSPIRQVAPRTSLRGLHDDYGHLTADVVLLEGEIHALRKPVSSTIRADKRLLHDTIFQGLTPLHFY
jgi:hypothetical protein